MWIWWVLALLAYLAVMALILSAGCRMVGVRPPELFLGMLICFIVLVAQATVELIIVVVLAVGAGITGMPPQQQAQDLAVQALLIAIPLGILVTAAIYSIMLQECSFGRALLVWLAQLVALILFVMAIAGVFYALQKA